VIKDLDIDTLKEAATFNCGYCRGFYFNYDFTPIFWGTMGGWVHTQQTASKDVAECESGRLWTYIMAREKSTQQEVG